MAQYVTGRLCLTEKSPGKGVLCSVQLQWQTLSFLNCSSQASWNLHTNRYCGWKHFTAMDWKKYLPQVDRGIKQYEWNKSHTFMNRWWTRRCVWKVVLTNLIFLAYYGTRSDDFDTRGGLWRWLIVPTVELTSTFLSFLEQLKSDYKKVIGGEKERGMVAGKEGGKVVY